MNTCVDGAAFSLSFRGKKGDLQNDQANSERDAIAFAKLLANYGSVDIEIRNRAGELVPWR